MFGHNNYSADDRPGSDADARHGDAYEPRKDPVNEVDQKDNRMEEWKSASDDFESKYSTAIGELDAIKLDESNPYFTKLTDLKNSYSTGSIEEYKERIFPQFKGDVEGFNAFISGRRSSLRKVYEMGTIYAEFGQRLKELYASSGDSERFDSLADEVTKEMDVKFPGSRAPNHGLNPDSPAFRVWELICEMQRGAERHE